MTVFNETTKATQQVSHTKHQWRMILAMTTLLLCCLATAPCGYLLLNLRRLQLMGKTLFYIGVILALDMSQCWLLMCFTIPTQLKGGWLFGHQACVMQAFVTRVLRGGAHLALVILSMQGCRCTPWLRGCNQVLRHNKLVFFFGWALVGSVSVFPFVVSDAKYTFNVSFSHCDVSKKYFVIHDVITFCLPATFLTFMSVRLCMCMCHTQTKSSSSRTSSNDRVLPSEPHQMDYDGTITITETTHMTSHEGDMTSRGDSRSQSDIKLTMTVCFLCSETALLMTLEWAFRLWGAVAPAATFLACSVLFCCAGQVVRSATIIIIESTYRAASQDTTQTTSCVTDDDMTSRNILRRGRDRAKAEIDRQECVRRRQQTLSQIKNKPQYQAEAPPRHKLSSCSECSMRPSSSRRHDSTATSTISLISRPSVRRGRFGPRSAGSLTQGSADIGLPYEGSHGGSNPPKHQVLRAVVPPQERDLQDASNHVNFSAFVPERKLAQQRPFKRYMNCGSRGGGGLLARLSPRTMRTNKADPESEQLRGNEESTHAQLERSSQSPTVTERMAFLRKRLQDIGVTGGRAAGAVPRQRSSFNESRMRMPARLFSSLWSSPVTRRSASQGGRAALRPRVRPPHERVKPQTERVERAETKKPSRKGKGKKGNKQTRKTTGSPATSTSYLHTVATEDSQWDCSPDTLSAVWLTQPTLQTGRFQQQGSCQDMVQDIGDTADEH